MNAKKLIAVATAGIVGFAALAYAQGVQILTTLTGTEQIGLLYPCTVSCATTTATLAGYTRSIAGAVNYANALIGGDFSTNPYQRGTSQAANIANTLTYGPDQWWFLGGASSGIQWSQQAVGNSTVIIDYLNYNRFQRASGNTDVAAVCQGQVLETKNSVRFQGHTAFLELWSLAGANYSGGAVTITVAYGTDTDGTAANFASGSWTNYTAATVATGTGTATFTPTTTWTRKTVGFTIPSQVAATQVTDIGIKMCWTPAGTAGANDWVGLTGIQLEVNDTGVPSSFSHRPVGTELYLAQRYFQAVNEAAANVGMGIGVSDSTTTCIVTLPLQDTMRVAPTVTFGGTALGATTFQVRKTAANIVLSTPFLAQLASNTITAINLTATTGATQVAGQACALQGANGGAKIFVSAEL